MPSAASCDPSGSRHRLPRHSPTGAPTWAVEAFSRLRTANGGTLGGFFDLFA